MPINALHTRARARAHTHTHSLGLLDSRDFNRAINWLVNLSLLFPFSLPVLPPVCACISDMSHVSLLIPFAQSGMDLI